MPTIKTAISIEKPVFDQMDDLAKKLKISRSRIFAMAAEEFRNRRDNIELLKKINEAYKDCPDSEPIVAMMRKNHFQPIHLQP